MYKEKELTIAETMETYGCKDIPVKQLLTSLVGNETKAERLLNNIGSHIETREDFYDNIQTKNYNDIKEAGKLTDKETTRVMAAIEFGKRFSDNIVDISEKIDSPMKAKQVLHRYLAYENHEIFLCALINNKNNIMKIIKIAEGSLTQATLHMREILAPAICCHAAAFIIAHNHPAGNPEPSNYDNELTKAIEKAAQVVGIPLMDHIIIGVGTKRYYSYKENGKIKN